MPLLPVLALADDLSGAAETAAAIALGERTEILLRADADSAAAVITLDLDTRHRSPGDAAAAIASALRTHDAGLVFKKVDSTLRGNLAAEIAALHGAPLVVATALPTFARTVRRGVVHVAGEPLHRTSAWAAEAAAPPPSIASALPGIETAVVELETVRSPALPAVLGTHMARGVVPICDAETDADLDAIVTAALEIPGCRLVGSGGLAAALGRSLSAECSLNGDSRPENAHLVSSQRSVLVVVGTAAPLAAEQVRRLDAHHIPLRANDLRRLDGLNHDVTVLTLEPPITLEPRRTARALADLVVAAIADRPVDLVLTGGETARCVLDAARVTRLTPVRSIHHGAVECRTSDGRSVVIRPGSFGDVDSLVRIVTAMTTSTKGARAH